MNNNDMLYSEWGRLRLIKEYIEDRRSTYYIGKLFDVHSTTIRNAMLYHQIPLRDKSEAQKAAIEHGVSHHPTINRKRTDAEKKRIGKTQAKVWRKMSKEAYQQRCDIAKKHWDEMKPEDQQKLRDVAYDAMRRTCTEGSKLERFLANGLRLAGYAVETRIKVLDHPIDILIAGERVVIDVLGPSSLKPIWGDEMLARKRAEHEAKFQALAQAGYHVFVVRSSAQTMSDTILQQALDNVIDGLQMAKTHMLPVECRILNFEVKSRSEVDE